MSLKLQVTTDSFGHLLINVEGDIDYESSDDFRQELLLVAKNYQKARLTLNMQGLEFVGSCGIHLFVETLNLLINDHPQVKLMNLKSEFQKIFRLYQLQNMEHLLSEEKREEDEVTDITSLILGKI